MKSEPAVPPSALVEAVAGAARDWRDPEHPARVEAVRRTLDAPNRFTEEALAFAVNAATHRLTPEALRAWWGERPAPTPCAVAVVPGEGGAPLAGLRAALAVVLAGHRCVFCSPEDAPAFVPAFAETVQQHGAGEVFTTSASPKAAITRAEAALGGGGSGAQGAFKRLCNAANLPPARRHWRGASFSVAVLDGEENEEAREGLAEDALLYEGRGRESVRLVWAPAGTAPDAYLGAMAHFRAVFPAHPDTPGALQMQKAFLDARDQPYAHGEGLEFLMSRGTPEVQAPGHLRWAEYDALGEVQQWLDAHAVDVHAVVALSTLGGRASPPARPPGTVHRQVLDAAGTGSLLDFTAGL